MPVGAQAWVIYGIVGVIWLALLTLAGITGQFDQAARITSIVPALLVSAMVFERYFWRWGPLHPHVVHMPVLRGTWRGELTSLWIDPETGQRPAAKTVYLAIEQTLTTISVRLHSDESSSEQISGIVGVRKGTNERVVIWTYLNTPAIALRERSRPHYGGALLTVFGDPPTRLRGEYWTDRQSKGSLEFHAYSPELADSFEQAAGLEFRDTNGRPAA